MKIKRTVVKTFLFIMGAIAIASPWFVLGRLEMRVSEIESIIRPREPANTDPIVKRGDKIKDVFLLPFALVGEMDKRQKELALQPTLLSSYAKGRPSLMIFWTPSCPHCIKSLGQLSEIRGKYPEESFGIIAVAPFTTPEFTTNEEREKFMGTLSPELRENASKAEKTIEMVHGETSLGNAFEEYGINGVPAFVFFNGDGVVTYSKAGAIPNEAIMEQIDALLKR